MNSHLAHAGHWLANLVYIAPLSFLVAVVGWGKLKDRRAHRTGREPTEHGGA